MIIRCAIVLVLALPTVLAAAPAQHVVLISIDGLRPEFYLDSTWPAPFLQHLAREGAHAETVRTVFPSVTYPSHTTMVTGALPARHGIYYNSPFEPEGATGRWYWEAEAIEVPTLWDAARAAGLTSASISWPVSVGAPVDFNVPEIWPLDDYDPIEWIRAHSTPEGYLAEVEREATGRLKRSNFNIEHMALDDTSSTLAAYLLETERPNLITLHLVTTDHFQHEDGREALSVRRAVVTVDRAVSRIWEAAQRAGILDSLAIVVTGDHGHVDRHTKIAPNTWLVEAGLRSAELADGWRATFHTTAASAFLKLADPQDTAAVDAVRAKLEALPPGTRKLFRIVERPELDRLGAPPGDVLALDPEPGVDIGGSATGPPLGSTRGATHGYVPDFPQMQTGLIAWGSGVRPGARAPQLDLADVAVLVAHLLGVELPVSDGTLPRGFVDVGDAD